FTLVCSFNDRSTPPSYALSLHDALPISDLESVDAAAAAVYFPNGQICEMNSPTRNPFWHWRLFLNVLSSRGRRRFHLEKKDYDRSEEHTSELQSRFDLVCRLLLEKKKQV